VALLLSYGIFRLQGHLPFNPQHLPDLDGLEVCKRIRTWSDVPIIVLSADGSEDRKVDALEHGADDYMTKPFGMRELHARVQVALFLQSDPSVGYRLAPAD
jgi:DNA-binding response OmpR family regulator